MPHLTNWSAGPATTDPYVAPECRGFCLQGTVIDHPELPDGDTIRTSPIKSVDGARILTHSGTVYSLGEPHEGYLAFCQQYYGPDWTYDPDSPLKLLET